MWDCTDDFENQYHCTSSFYLLSCLALESSIIIYIEVRATVHVKCLGNSLNDINKQMLKLVMENLLNLKLIRNDPIFSNSCRFIKTKKIKM